MRYVKTRELLIAAAFLLLSVPSFAEQDPKIAAELQSILANIGSFSAQLEQITREADGYLLDTQQGKMHFARPNLLRWDTEQPFAQTLVADGDNIFLHDPDLNQVTIRPWRADPTSNPFALFTVPEQFVEYFTITSDKDWFYLDPLAESASFQQLRLEFKKGLPTLFEIDDNLGQTNSIEFSKIITDAPVDATLFRFEIPEGAEVLDDR